ncbi:unnamed protein product [Rhizophagus irregularis]|uniref:Protein kinase domain-containing protein n=1 Tax=Rhizophagus irregularis (strain DAOM 181602 / DAOM 197198 / MUCL 43194) TaxID=747089 RepID=U9SNQ0_RHIID|nr:unnamed protein product [Rhizophagus irregularis]
MEQTNYKLKINFLITDDNTSLINNNQPQKTSTKSRLKKCRECNRKRKNFNEIHQICHLCFKAKSVTLSGNKVIDDFIRYTLTNRYKKAGKMEFVQFDRFINIKLISEGGFSKIYKATWMDGPISRWNDKQQNYRRDGEMIVVLKELNDSKNIDSKQLSELKVFYNLILQHRNHGDYNDFDNHNYTTKYFVGMIN